MSSLLRAWYIFLALGLLTFIVTAFIGRVPYVLTSGIAAPNQLFFAFGANIRQTTESLIDRRNLREENVALKDSLASEKTRNRALEIQIERLEELLKVRSSQGVAAVMSAPVTSVSPSPVIRQLVVGKGSNAGVKKHMPVTTAQGIVGIVTKIGPRSAGVRAITDPESAVGVTVRGRGGQGIAVGVPGGRLRVINFKEDQPVEQGDILETSSRGGLFPKGIRVGQIIDVPSRNLNSLRVEFLVEPSVDVTTLMDVILLEPL